MRDSILRSGTERGFSMTELLIVLAVGAIIAASAIVLADFIIDQYNLVIGADAVANQLQFTRMRAVSSNEASSVRFPGGNAYRVENEAGTVLAGPFQLPHGVEINTRDGGDPVSFPGDQVIFLPNGALPLSGTGSAGRVKLVNQSGLRIDILVDGGGMVRKTPPYHSEASPF